MLEADSPSYYSQIQMSSLLLLLLTTASNTGYILWDISHDLVACALKHFNLPKEEITYIVNVYTNLAGKVVTKDWTTLILLFKTGIFQGDPMSPIIFPMVFQPLLTFIQEQKNQGFDFKCHIVKTLHFADDFNLFVKSLKHSKHSLIQFRIKA